MHLKTVLQSALHCQLTLFKDEHSTYCTSDFLINYNCILLLDGVVVKLISMYNTNLGSVCFSDCVARIRSEEMCVLLRVSRLQKFEFMFVSVI